MATAKEVLRNMKSRTSDRFGSGQYGASRGNRTHKGLDISTTPGEQVYSPISGNVIRETIPYANDPSLKGLLIKGTGTWAGYEVRIFYMQGSFTGAVSEGQLIGQAQSLQGKYPGITNHIHIEVKKNGAYIDPFEIWQMSF